MTSSFPAVAFDFDECAVVASVACMDGMILVSALYAIPLHRILINRFGADTLVLDFGS